MRTRKGSIRRSRRRSKCPVLQPLKSSQARPRNSFCVQQGTQHQNKRHYNTNLVHRLRELRRSKGAVGAQDKARQAEGGVTSGAEYRYTQRNRCEAVFAAAEGGAIHTNVAVMYVREKNKAGTRALFCLLRVGQLWRWFAERGQEGNRCISRRRVPSPCVINCTWCGPFVGHGTLRSIFKPRSIPIVCVPSPLNVQH